MVGSTATMNCLGLRVIALSSCNPEKDKETSSLALLVLTTYHTMDNDDEVHTALTGALDPKLMLAATTILIAAGVGTWKAFSPSSILARHRREQHSDQSGNALKAETDSVAASDKKKRARDRRKRTPLPKLPRGPNPPAVLAPPAGPKKVIRQPSAISAKKQRPRTPSISEHSDAPVGQVVPEDVEDEISRPAGSSHNIQIEHDNNVTIYPDTGSDTLSPEKVALPVSPEPRRSHSPPPPSPSASTSGSTSGTPHTPPSIAASQLSLPPLSTESSPWQWEQKNTKDSPPAHQRGRKRPTRQSQSSASSPFTTTFPTLNTLPPPNTPLDAQIEFMKNQVENFRAREEENRLREEALLQEMERLRFEAEQSRQETSRLQWQLNDISQREERLISQLNALTMQMQAMQGRPGQPSSMPMAIPVPLYQPQPIPYVQPPGHLSFYHPHAPTGPYPGGSPMMGPLTPTSLVSPTHLHPLMTVPIHPLPMPSSGTPTTPLETFRGGSRGSMRVNHSSTPIMSPTSAEGSHDSNEDTTISFGLMEAIFKRPESYAASQGSRSGSNKSARSPSASLSPPNSMGVRSITVSRSPSVSGQQTAENDGLSGVASLSLPPPARIPETVVTEKDYEINSENPLNDNSIPDDYLTIEINGKDSAEEDHTPEQKAIPPTVTSSYPQPPLPSVVQTFDIANDSAREKGQSVHVYY